MAKAYALTIEVPDFDEKAAYDHDRPISGLVRAQLVHLHTAEHLWLPSDKRTDININDLLSERQAAEYIQQITARLHAQGKATSRKVATGGKAKAGKKAVKKSRTVSRKTAAVIKLRKTKSAAKKRKARK